jgi:hypothetical protein
VELREEIKTLTIEGGNVGRDNSGNLLCFVFEVRTRDELYTETAYLATGSNAG